MHAMRVRVISSPAFSGQKVIAAILFEQTMDGEADGRPVPTYLWEHRHVVPLVKVDKGLEAEADARQPDEGRCPRSMRCSTGRPGSASAGTKKRSTIRLPDERGIAAIAAQQFEVGAQIARHGLIPILEPEVLLKSPDRRARRGNPARRAQARPRRPPVRPPGDAQAHHPRSARLLSRADRAPALRPAWWRSRAAIPGTRPASSSPRTAG